METERYLKNTVESAMDPQHVVGLLLAGNNFESTNINLMNRMET